MAPSKMLALLALLALSWSAATATNFLQGIPTTAALATINHPCAQYCMLQQPFATVGSPFLSLFLQQHQAFPIVGSPLLQQQQQCALQCAAVLQAIQQQQLAFISNPLATAMQVPFLSSPVAAAMQFPYLSSPVAAAMQAPLLSNPLAAAMIQSPYLFNPAAVAIQSPYLFNNFNQVAASMQVPFLADP